jgi:hypothetical protein
MNRTSTADLGVELCLGLFKLKNADPMTMLPSWVERGAEIRDVDNGGEAEADGGCDSDMDLGLDVEPCEDDDDADAAPAPAAEIPDGASNEYMPNAYILAGVQHVTDNLNADSNKSMGNFASFFKDLKLLEAGLLSHRRERFQWTCLRRGRHAHLSKKFDNFTGSLYEARWHEVVTFLKKVRPLIVIMCFAFDARRYNSGVDVDGLEMSDAAKTRARKERASGTSEFDAARLQQVLRSGFFHLYVEVVFHVDVLPTEFAMDLELCPCHRALFDHLNSYQQQLVLTAHYGKGVKSCPMAGKNLPESIGGGLEIMFKKLSARSERKLREFKVPPMASPLTSNDWDTCFRDLRQGTRAGFVLFKIKMDYVEKEPISFGCVAIADESVAREFARKARDRFRRDMRQEVHDARTWRLMAPGAVFSRELDRFLDEGVPRHLLDNRALEEIAVFRLAMMLETIMEQRHAIASCALKKHFIGPVPLSLSNRLPMLERMVRLGHVTGTEVLEAFAHCLQLLRQGNDFGVGLHQTLNTAHTPASMRVSLAKVIYRCNLDDMYISQACQKKHHESEKTKAVSANARLLAKDAAADAEHKDKPPGDLNYMLVLRESMNDHLRHAFDKRGAGDDVDNGQVFSASRGILEVASLSQRLDEPRTKRSRLETASEKAENELHAVEESTAVDTQNIYFESVWQNIGKKRTVPISIGAGQTLANSDAAVYVHAKPTPMDDGHVLLPSASERSDPTDANYILSGCSVDATVDDLRSQVLSWQKGSTWTLDCDDESTLIQAIVLRALVDADALPGRTTSAGYKHQGEDELAFLQKLQARGFASPNATMGPGRWFFTQEGWERCISIPMCHSPRQVFKVRENLALEDATGYELLMILQDQGWRWDKWVSMGKRKKGLPAIPVGFTSGSPLLFFTTKVVSRLYLRALLTSDDSPHHLAFPC